MGTDFSSLVWILAQNRQLNFLRMRSLMYLLTNWLTFLFFWRNVKFLGWLFKMFDLLLTKTFRVRYLQMDFLLLGLLMQLLLNFLDTEARETNRDAPFINLFLFNLLHITILNLLVILYLHLIIIFLLIIALTTYLPLKLFLWWNFFPILLNSPFFLRLKLPD